MTEPVFLLDANSLLSKWGFGDGDGLRDWWWDNFNEDPPFNDHDALFALVEGHLVPKMRDAGWDVVLERIDTIHNPVRAGRINDVEVDWYAGDRPIPIEVWVTLPQVQAACKANEGETNA